MGTCTAALLSNNCEKEIYPVINDDISEIGLASIINFKSAAVKKFDNKDNKFLNDFNYGVTVINKISRGYIYRKKFRNLESSKNLKILKNYQKPKENNINNHETPGRTDLYTKEKISVHLIKEKKVYKEIKLDKHRIYYGECVGERREGLGRIVWTDGTEYYGLLNDNKANGYGKLIHKEGDVYIGNWLDDKANGVGKYINNNDSSFVGYWLSYKKQLYFL